RSPPRRILHTRLCLLAGHPQHHHLSLHDALPILASCQLPTAPNCFDSRTCVVLKCLDGYGFDSPNSETTKPPSAHSAKTSSAACARTCSTRAPPACISTP